MYIRKQMDEMARRMQEPRRRIQILFGPRQVGKTTLARQMMEVLPLPYHYETADAHQEPEFPWLEHHWGIARREAVRASGTQGAVLILDEAQKVPSWSELVKRLWDEDTANGVPLNVLLLGSSPLLMQRGLSESLAGRFEQIHLMHWSYGEMREAFGWDLESYIFFGGYPGAVDLVGDERRWSRYVRDAIIEPSLVRDVIDMEPIRKPALLRQLFTLACEYGSQVLSYNKMLGQLHDAGNTTTLAHYLELLSRIGMVSGLSKFGRTEVQRRDIPKLQVFNTALMSARGALDFETARRDQIRWGRLVESAVGAHILNSIAGDNIAAYYWREGDKEVDFVLQHGSRIAAIEVKSGHKRTGHSGLNAFSERFAPDRVLLVGGGGMPLEEFLQTPVKDLFRS